MSIIVRRPSAREILRASAATIAALFDLAVCCCAGVGLLVMLLLWFWNPADFAAVEPVPWEDLRLILVRGLVPGSLFGSLLWVVRRL